MKAKKSSASKKRVSGEQKSQSFYDLYSGHILAILVSNKVRPKKKLVAELSRLTLTAHSTAFSFAFSKRGH